MSEFKFEIVPFMIVLTLTVGSTVGIVVAYVRSRTGPSQIARFRAERNAAMLSGAIASFVTLQLARAAFHDRHISDPTSQAIFGIGALICLGLWVVAVKCALRAKRIRTDSAISR